MLWTSVCCCFRPLKIHFIELDRGKILKTEKVLLVLVCEIHFWVSCFLYSLEICLLVTIFTRCFAKLGQQSKKDKTYIIELHGHYFLRVTCCNEINKSLT